MQMMLTAFGGSTAATTTAAASTTAATTASTAAATISTEALLKGAVNAFAVLGQVRAAEAKATGLRTMAKTDEIAANLANVEATNRTNNLREGLLESIGQNRAAAGNAGLDESSVRDTEAKSARRAGTAIDIARASGALRSSGLRFAAEVKRNQADNTELIGLLRAGSGLLESFRRDQRRGEV